MVQRQFHPELSPGGRSGRISSAEERINQVLSLPDGRHLGFAEYGPESGRPVFYFHGSASSRLDRPADESVLPTLDIRLVVADRPGHGLSDFQPRRRLLDWPEDVRHLADHLGIDSFYIAGQSAGGPHTLACAYQLPERVLAGAVISGMAPMTRPGATNGMPLPNRLLAVSARRLPVITRLLRWMTRRMVMADVEQATRQLMASIPEADKAVLYAPENVEIMVQTIREGFRAGAKGVVHDDMLVNREWGFDPAGVQPRIDIWHGDADVTVPVHAATYLHDKLPQSRLTILPGVGHFFFLDHWQEVLATLVA